MASFGCKCESQCLQASNVAKLSILFVLSDSLTEVIESWKYPLGMLYKHDRFTEGLLNNGTVPIN